MRKLFLASGALIALLFVIGLALPRHGRVQAAIEIDAYNRDEAAGPDIQNVGMEFSFIFGQIRKAAEILEVGGIQEVTIKAGELVNMVAEQVGGKGGGRPDMAMAGGSQPENLSVALESVQPWLEARLV